MSTYQMTFVNRQYRRGCCLYFPQVMFSKFKNLQINNRRETQLIGTSSAWMIRDVSGWKLFLTTQLAYSTLKWYFSNPWTRRNESRWYQLHRIMRICYFILCSPCEASSGKVAWHVHVPGFCCAAHHNVAVSVFLSDLWLCRIPVAIRKRPSAYP